MRKSLGPKPIIYPMPVLIISAYDENDVPNAMNAAWGTICDTSKIAIVLSHDHKTVKNIFLKKAFTVSIADKENVIPADFVGIVSGNNEPDKMKKTGWSIVKSESVDAPIIENLPLTLECKYESYDEDTEILIGEIVNISADEKILTDGKIDLSKFSPICYDSANHKYLTLGEVVGNAFSDGKKIK